MRLPFESAGAKQLNSEIFETIYFAGMSPHWSRSLGRLGNRLGFTLRARRHLARTHARLEMHAAMTKSCELAKVHGPYESYALNGGCPVSKGILQPDMWNVTPSPRWVRAFPFYIFATMHHARDYT